MSQIQEAEEEAIILSQAVSHVQTQQMEDVLAVGPIIQTQNTGLRSSGRDRNRTTSNCWVWQ